MTNLISKRLAEIFNINFAIITTADYLVTWANAVNRCGQNNKVEREMFCALQDIYGQSRIVDIHNNFLQLHKDGKSADFRQVIFSVGKAMGMDSQIEILNVYSKFKANEYLEAEYKIKFKELDEQESELIQKQILMDDKERKMRTDMAKLTKEYEVMTNRCSNLEDRIAKAIKENRDLADDLREMQPDAEKFRNLKSIFFDLVS